jgi:predicted dehydrogenase
MASGGTDFYANRQWPDNVMAILQYPAPQGAIRAMFQVLTTTSAGTGAFEHFMGTEGSLKISENPRWTKFFHEAYAPDWEPWTKRGYLVKEGVAGAAEPAAETKAQAKPEDPNEIKVRETGEILGYDLPIKLDKPPHQYHLENFLDAIRGKATLTCPADEALKSEAVVLKVNEAVELRRLVEIKPGDLTL